MICVLNHQVHEFDELRFDIRAHDCNYFLRASSVQEKESWMEAIEANKVSYQVCIGASLQCCVEMHSREWF